MNATPQTPSPRRARWVALAFALALGVFTALTVRDAGRPAVRAVAGGTFTGRDVDGRLVQVCLFEQDGGWQGWLYREGREQTEWFSTTNRAHPWQAMVNVRERVDVPKLPEPVVASTDDALRLNATLPRTNGWASDTANLTRQFEHLSFRRLTGLRLGKFGGTTEYYAQFPKLPDKQPFHAALAGRILNRFENHADDFTTGPLDFWKDNIQHRTFPPMNAHVLSENWQLRLLTTNLASFVVWSYVAMGGSGNHSRWDGLTYQWQDGMVTSLGLSAVFKPVPDWKPAFRERCLEKLKSKGHSGPGQVSGDDIPLSNFTLSPTGLQIYFNPYEIVSGADGEFVVHFDYAELKDLLRTDGPAALLPRAP
ncbi:MAG: RsiV family protein [Limisphaerales bacterium]